MMNVLYKNLSKTPITVYRGIQKMTTDDVRKMIDKPHLPFFSTTKLLKYDFYTSPYLGCCLLEINVPKNSPILDISKFSKYKDEEEIVLAPGMLIYKAEYNQKLENYMGDVYMKVYQCDYKPFFRYKVNIKKAKDCLKISNEKKLNELDFMIKKIFYKS